jgi:hypothetical protein
MFWFFTFFFKLFSYKHNELNKKNNINFNFKLSLEFLESEFFRTIIKVSSEGDDESFNIKTNFKF